MGALVLSAHVFTLNSVLALRLSAILKRMRTKKGNEKGKGKRGALGALVRSGHVFTLMSVLQGMRTERNEKGKEKWGALCLCSSKK